MRLIASAPGDRQVIERYGPAGFRISGQDYAGSVVVRPERTVAWPVTDLTAATDADLDALIAAAAGVQVLLLGCGRRALPVPAALRGRGIPIEPMDTGAACRTYSVLLAENRLVAAALIALG